MKYGLALIPEKSFIDICIGYQNELKKLFPNLRPTLAHDTNLPHITIFQGTWKNLDYAKILKTISDQEEFRSLKSVKISDFQIIDDRWLFLNVADEKGFLQKIHEFTYSKIKESIDLSAINQKETDYYTPKQKEYFAKYGYRFAFDLYIPHFTLGRIENINQDQALVIKDFTRKFLKNNKLSSILIDRVCYRELGDAGSFANQILCNKTG